MSNVEDKNSVYPGKERAEELVDRAVQRAGHWAALAGAGVVRVAALARESTEDMWAEAQSMRRERQAAGSKQAVQSGDGAEATRETEANRQIAAGHTEQKQPDKEQQASS